MQGLVVQITHLTQLNNFTKQQNKHTMISLCRQLFLWALWATGCIMSAEWAMKIHAVLLHCIPSRDTVVTLLNKRQHWNCCMSTYEKCSIGFALFFPCNCNSFTPLKLLPLPFWTQRSVEILISSIGIF